MENSIWLKNSSITNLNSEHDDEEDYSGCVETIFSNIMLQNYTEDDFDDAKKIGRLELHYYNLAFALNNEIGIFDVFDRSMNTIESGEVLIDFKTGFLKESIINQIGESFNSNILLIQEFDIYPEFRNKGIGEQVVKGLLKLYEGRCGYVALKSFPKQIAKGLAFEESENHKNKMELHLLEKDSKKAQQSLNRFYKRCGFEKLKGKSNYFIVNLEPC